MKQPGSSEVDRFADLFAGRVDVIGLAHGECFRTAVTPAVYRGHLDGTHAPIGIYPLVQSPAHGAEWAQRLGGGVGDNFVKWGCSDIDQDNPALAWNLYGALQALGIDAWIERTKSKGYHVWVFADEWVPALVMRRSLLVAHEVAGVAPTEVNPKQVDVGTRVKYGNYVNLPYPHSLINGDHAYYSRDERRVMIDREGRPLNLEQFVHQAEKQRTSFDKLRAAGKLYREPPKPTVVVDRPEGDAVHLGTKLPGLAWKIFAEGPLAGRDRSGTLQRLAFLCAEAGLSPGETLTIIANADMRWGKFHGRADCDEQLAGIVNYAFTHVPMTAEQEREYAD